MSGEQDPYQARNFTIQQVARLTGLSEYTLRYYEKIGLIDPVDRDGSSGHRRYDADELARITGTTSLHFGPGRTNRLLIPGTSA